MHADELMIGDWYYDQDLNKPRKWHQLQFAEEYGNSTYMVLVKPIPLTKDILKTNGWHHHLSVNCHNHNWSLGDLWLTKDLELFVYKMHIKIKYVHQLQHVLRLVGMSDLANNFKICSQQ